MTTPPTPSTSTSSSVSTSSDPRPLRPVVQNLGTRLDPQYVPGSYSESEDEDSDFISDDDNFIDDRDVGFTEYYSE